MEKMIDHSSDMTKEEFKKMIMPIIDYMIEQTYEQEHLKSSGKWGLFISKMISHYMGFIVFQYQRDLSYKKRDVEIIIKLARANFYSAIEEGIKMGEKAIENAKER
jgi:hypothetical protein